MRECPHHHRTLQQMIIDKTEIDYCPVCLGVFLDKGEIYDILSTRNPNLRFEDIKLTEQKTDLIAYNSFLCPNCALPMRRVVFQKGGFALEACPACEGIWLEKGELGKILEFLEEQGVYKLEKETWKVVLEELQEVFVGPKPFQEELGDLIIVLRFVFHKLLRDPGFWGILRSL